MKRRITAVATILIWLIPIAIARTETIAISNARIYTVSDLGVIEKGVILIDGGEITAVGADVIPPDGSRLIDADGAIVTPGFMASYTHLGLVEIVEDEEANDVQTNKEFGLGAAVDVQFALNSSSTLLPVTRMAGVTTALVAPVAGAGLFAGGGAVIHLGDGPDIIVKSQAGMFAALGAEGAALEGGTRAAAWTVLRESLKSAVELLENADFYKGKERDQRLPLADVRALFPVIQGRMPLVVNAHRAADLRQLVRLKAEFKIELIVLGAREGWRVASALATANIPVIVNPFENLPVNFESIGATLRNAARLQDAGVKIAFYGADVGETHNARVLSQLAGNAVANGMSWDAALAAVTRNPSEIWGISDRVGTIEPGKIANIVLWSNDPFELTTQVKGVFINGTIMPMESRATKLRDRYKDLREGSLPFAYKSGARTVP